MKVQRDIFTIDLQPGAECALQHTRERDGIAEYAFRFTWTKENAAANDGFAVSWQEPYGQIMYKWDVNSVLRRNLYVAWDDKFSSMLSQNAPVTCFFDGNDQNCYCWALSECKKLVTVKNGQDDGWLYPAFSFRTAQFTNQYDATIILRIDRRAVSLRRAVESVADWWSDACHMTPTHVPAAAKDPLYSFWYSYKQNINAQSVEEECRRAKELGFEICIIDDGWQTDDNGGGYGYCGDWRPAPSKFPDMAAHVRRVHEIGLKYLLWYSVPFMGHYAENYDRFRGMLLRDARGLHAAVLDPRYKEVREFLVEQYKNALLDWDLDGFKLDFIDEWCENAANAEYNEKMDIPALQDAVDACMTEITRQLTQIKPDVLLEFRQRYIGPHMKRFGNIFRVADCSGDYLRNRTTILDLRMLMGEQAVHSDMLMMADSETAEKNAIQIISCMFGVMQYSGRLDMLPSETIAMSRFWLSFLKEHKKLLQSRSLKTFEAHLLYTWAMTSEENECAIGVYAIDKCVRPEAADTIYIANGCTGERILVELSGIYDTQILDCYGQEIERQEKELCGISALPVPVGGLIILRKQKR